MSKESKRNSAASTATLRELSPTSILEKPDKMYLWIKAFHIISVITWMAGIFYLPRLFVYHVTAKDDISNERFKVMEDKLYRLDYDAPR
jgi:uncharacterized membrane protein